jgi:hypothetical protein
MKLNFVKFHPLFFFSFLMMDIIRISYVMVVDVIETTSKIWTENIMEGVIFKCLKT